MTYQSITYSSRIVYDHTVVLPEPPYAGPGDVVAGATAFWGLRAYTLALVGNTIVRLRRDSDNAEQDFTTVVGGGVDTAAITSFKGAANLYIVKFYDQLGDSAKDNYNSTAATQPLFILSPKTLMRFTGLEFLVASGLDIIISPQPWTISIAAKRTGGSVAGDMWILGETNGRDVGFFPTASNLASCQCDSSGSAAATDGVFHAIQFVANGASSDLNVDGTVNTKSVGTSQYGGGASRTNFNLSRNAIADVYEGGLWPLGFTSTQSANMSANQHGFWGF